MVYKYKTKCMTHSSFCSIDANRWKRKRLCSRTTWRKNQEGNAVRREARSRRFTQHVTKFPAFKGPERSLSWLQKFANGLYSEPLQSCIPIYTVRSILYYPPNWPRGPVECSVQPVEQLIEHALSMKKFTVATGHVTSSRDVSRP